jgi:prepilin-type N-terminal cleavage/methylation domain-containing protein/prepilin-type processing-associated H-X9-DG protein
MGAAPTRRAAGYTLLELLVVIAIIAILLALLLPAVQKVREAAARMACSNHLRQMGLACHNFEGTFGFFPSSIQTTGPQRSWAVQFLPWIEQGNVARLYDFNRHWCEPANAEAVSKHLPTFYCPSSPYGRRSMTGWVRIKLGDRRDWYFVTAAACTDYAVIDEVKEDPYVAGYVDVRGYGVLREDQFPRVGDVTDGTSNTVMITECAGRPDWWVRGKLIRKNEETDSAPWASRDNDYGLDGFDLTNHDADAGPCAINCSNSNEVYSFHPGGANAVMADGSVRFLSDKVSTRLFARLVTRSGGEVVSWADY